MKNILDALIIAVLFFSLFGIQHSVLASLQIKEKLKSKIGSKIAFYRLFFNIESLLTFLLFYYLSPHPRVVVYRLQPPWDLVVLGFQGMSLLLLFWVALHLDWKEFSGIAQILRYFRGEYKAEELDETSEFRIEGPYKYVRHPAYLFSIFFLLFRPSMDLFYFTAFVCMTAYFFAGAYFEEKKLEKIFGAEYEKYKQTVPMILPIKFRRRRSESS